MAANVDGPTMDKFDFDEAVQKWNKLKMRRLDSCTNKNPHDQHDWNHIVFINIVKLIVNKCISL